ncbi:hypothetical protein EJ08DRAFT_635171 [Tothia fuscella]|uniref:Dopey N-terminal domain-containing protein n=1 Tax=Tothia fuscella TaxID=1048955 RepID=A0A9P4NPV6_9PEZI|nr:hypothetical protein EJ08DRAFT_635171 [Tothia fuscella]
MSLDPGSLRAASPASSGRASPINRLRGNHIEAGINPKDKAYRRYASGVERALSSFDTAQQEWADYISFLGRLLKALQAHPPVENVGIPDADTVALRLAQCLNPSLPSGVHQKALEVYAYVFTSIGKANLARDLHLYFPGLSSVLSFASLSVRPYFLALLESHILLIDATALRPALKAIILSLLPGLEDETSEDFEDIVRVLDKFREASRELHSDVQEGDDSPKDSFFWQCFFLATITSPSRRQGALGFLVRQLPKFHTKAAKGNEQGAISMRSLSPAAQDALSPEPGLLIRCFAAGLSDNQLLVQRGFLDMLVTHLPLDSAVLQYAVPKADLDQIVFAAAGVVSRRDMSLNRRLWAWFLGPEPKDEAEGGLKSPVEAKSPIVDLSSHHAAYFARYGLRSLTRSILALFDRKISAPAERAKPFRMCLSLMDRWEVGGLLIPDLFIPAITNAFEYSQTASKTEIEEVIKSASIFFDGVESGLIWAKFFEMVEKALRRDATVDDRILNLDLCSFTIQRFNLREEEMILYHMPISALAILIFLNRQSISPLTDRGYQQARALALDLADRLISVVPARAFLEPEKTAQSIGASSSKTSFDQKEIISTVHRFYEEDQGAIEGSSSLLSTALVGSQLLEECLALFVQSTNASTTLAGLDSLTKLLSTLLPIIPGASSISRNTDVLSSLQSALAPKESRNSGRPDFSIVAAVATTIGTIQQIDLASPYMSTPEVLGLQSSLIEILWDYLSPFEPKYHVEAVRCLWHLEAISSNNRCVEASLTRIISSSVSASSPSATVKPVEAARRFAILWTHSMQEKPAQGEKGQRAVPRRTSSTTGFGTTGIPSDPSTVLAQPLLLLLDSLAEDGTEIFAFVKTWLQHLSTLPKVFDILISRMSALKCFQQSFALTTASQKPGSSAKRNDVGECLYYMKHIFQTIKHASEHTWLTVAGEMIEPHYQQGDEEAERVPLQFLLMDMCMRALDITKHSERINDDTISELYRTSLETMLLLIQGPFSAPLKESHVELPLLERLQRDLNGTDPLLQRSLLDTITVALKLQFTNLPPAPKSPHQRKFSRDQNPSSSSLLLAAKDRGSTDTLPSLRIAPPPSLVECLKAGFSSPSSRIILDSWVDFLVDVLPLFADTIFQNLIPLVECFCAQIGIVFDQLRSTFRQSPTTGATSPEPTLISLMNGLEQILARGHDRLVTDELKASNNKSPDQPQSFFGNMVQGVFNSESQQPTRKATANSRLAVLLCFQDTVRTCFAVWSWGVYGNGCEKQDTTSLASFSYTSLRMRNRARRLLEHLFAAEALECLETLAVLFCRSPSKDFQPESVMGLLNVLNGSRPKHTIPAIFNAIYSRTNPTALDSGRMSSLTSELSDLDVVGFLVDYLNSIEDDAMDEVWPDCMAFLKDVLTNPLPHSQILPVLLDFVALIAEKVDNTNFGEQRKMRKDLGDIFLRLLTAALTTRPMGFLQEPKQPTSKSRPRVTPNGISASKSNPRDFVSVLASTVPRLQLILMDNERISAAATSISTNVTGPTLRAKSFPANIDETFLDLLLNLTKVSQGSKAWRRDVSDALNDARFFSTPVELVQSHWAPIFSQLVLNDKDRMPELLGRLTAPTTAGIVFGVGATSARMEADKKTQLNLRRIALLVLSCTEDTFVPHIGTIEEKIVELLTTTPTSSPSSTTRSEVYIVLRALNLKTSSLQLAPLWPIINAELQKAILSCLPSSSDHDNYSNASILQACKLLDTLLTLEPDEFQLHEWLFITDTIDAVYRPTNLQSTALADEIAEALGDTTISNSASSATVSSSQGLRKPVLEPLLRALEKEEGVDVKLMARGELAARVLRPFFGGLSICAFEGMYGMEGVDWDACVDGLVRDIFEDGEVASAAV